MLKGNVMPAIKKILFPVDFSAQCFGAARHVEVLAGWFQAEIMLRHVVGNGTNTLAEELKPRSQARLNAFLAGELKHFTTQRVCVVGDPSWTPLSTNATCQLEKVERNSRIGGFGCVFGAEVRSSPLLPKYYVTTNNLQNVGDGGRCLRATMLSTK